MWVRFTLLQLHVITVPVITQPASSYPPSHPPSDFRYTFPRPPTRNFARTPHEVLLLEYRQEEHGE